jgi:glucokinase
MVVLGIDVGGHSIKAGIVTRKGNITDKETTLTEAEKGRDIVIENIIKIGKLLLKRNKEVTAVGIGIPGIVDKKGYVTYTPNIPLSKYDLGRALRSKLHKRIVFGNDADNFALAKHKFGAAKDNETIVCLTLGTGIGSGLIINGKLFENKGAPELGHTTIKFDGVKAKCCGNDGCIESYIGRKTFPEGPLEAYRKALAGNQDAKNRFIDFGRYLGIAISNFINIFNPDMVILGGQMSNAYEFFKRSMKKEIDKRTLFKTKVVRSQMHEPGVVGAGILAFK